MTLERLGKVRKTSLTCFYTDTYGRPGFSAMKGSSVTAASVPMEANCDHWDKSDTRWRGVWDVMFQGWIDLDVPSDKYISRTSLGVLDDLGFWVDYAEADDTAIAWADDPRNGAGKRHAHAALHVGHAPPTVMPSEAVEWIE